MSYLFSFLFMSPSMVIERKDSWISIPSSGIFIPLRTKKRQGRQSILAHISPDAAF